MRMLGTHTGIRGNTGYCQALLGLYLKGIIHTALDDLQQGVCSPADKAGVAVGDALAQLPKQLQRLPLCTVLSN